MPRCSAAAREHQTEDLTRCASRYPLSTVLRHEDNVHGLSHGWQIGPPSPLATPPSSFQEWVHAQHAPVTKPRSPTAPRRQCPMSSTGYSSSSSGRKMQEVPCLDGRSSTGPVVRCSSCSWMSRPTPSRAGIHPRDKLLLQPRTAERLLDTLPSIHGRLLVFTRPQGWIQVVLCIHLGLPHTLLTLLTSLLWLFPQPPSARFHHDNSTFACSGRPHANESCPNPPGIALSHRVRRTAAAHRTKTKP